MDAVTSTVPELQEKLNKCIDGLFDGVRMLITNENRKDADKKGKDDDFEGKIDIFPFFSLIVNLEKSLYETIIDHFAKDGSLDTLLKADKRSQKYYRQLEKNWGISRNGSEVIFPSLKSFKKTREVTQDENTRTNYLILDTERLFAYIKTLERLLCCTSTASFLKTIYKCFDRDAACFNTEPDKFKAKTCIKNGEHYELNPLLFDANQMEIYKITATPIRKVLKEAGYDKESIEDSIIEYFDDADKAIGSSSSLPRESLWALFTLKENDSDYDPRFTNGDLEQLFVFGVKDHQLSGPQFTTYNVFIVDSYEPDGRIIGTREERERNKINRNNETKVYLELLERIRRDKEIQNYLQLFIDICQYPAFSMPEGILERTLQQTYANVFQVLRRQRFIHCLQKANIKNRADLYAAVGFGDAKNRISNDFYYYIDEKRLTDEKIDKIASVLGVDSSLFREV